MTPDPATGFDLTHLFAIAAALGFASGLRLYAVLFITGAAGYLGWFDLPGALAILENPWMMGASFVLFAVEFFVDKVPGVDTLWDALHTLIRIPAGAALAAAAFGGEPATWVTIAALLGGGLAATAHATKATTRAAANTSPEPFSNIGLSLLGDGLVPTALFLAWHEPTLFLVLLAVGVMLMAITLVLLWKFLRGVIARLGRRYRRPMAPAASFENSIPPASVRRLEMR